MPSLIIHDDKGTEFFYRDSGRPQGEVYTTVLILHGLTFHSGVYERILPLAPSNQLRLICLNRRDYTGTALYSPADLEVLASGNETEHAAFLNARGLEIALVLDRIIDEFSIPLPTADGKDGGLALMGWSAGSTETLAAIAGVASFPPNLQHRLQLYLRRFILHEPPHLYLGMKTPPNTYNPLLDGPPELSGERFAHWVSGYFSHGDLSSHNIDNLTYKSPDPSRPASITAMTPAEFKSMVDTLPASRYELLLIEKFVPLFGKQASKALFDPVTRRLWPRLDVWLLYGDSAPWNIICAAWEVEARSKIANLPVKFNVLKGANHFVVWDEPERAISAFAHCIRD